MLQLESMFRALASMNSCAFKKDTFESRRALYQFYRLLNLVHLMAYLPVDARLKNVTVPPPPPSA